MKLHQQTAYPWNGRVRVTVQECGPAELGLRLRIPGWAGAAQARVNLAPVNQVLVPGEYFELRRQWRAGDIVDLELFMTAELVEANPLVEETVSQLAVKRGPIVYCLESIDLPEGVGVMDVAIAEGSDLLAQFDQGTLGGVVVIESEGFLSENPDWGGRPYRRLEGPKLRSTTLRLVPYFAWANRGGREMSVWLRRLPAGFSKSR